MLLSEFLKKAEQGLIFKIDLYNCVENVTGNFQLPKLRLLLSDLESYGEFLKTQLASLTEAYLWEIVVSKSDIMRWEKPAYLKYKICNFYITKSLHTEEWAESSVKQSWIYTMLYASVAQRMAFVLSEMKKYVTEKLEEAKRDNAGGHDILKHRKIKYAVAALYHYYIQESGEAPLFDRYQTSKGAAIMRAGEELGLDGRAFRKEYYKFTYRTNRVAANRIKDIEAAIEMLSQNAQSFPKAIALAKQELEEAKLKK